MPDSSATTTEPLCPGCGRPVSECQADDVDESPAAQIPRKHRVEPYVMVHHVPGSSIHSTRPIKVVAKAEYDRLRMALEKIADREPDLSSTNQTAFFWTWAKEVAEEALHGR